jgi:hypothetical protein
MDLLESRGGEAIGDSARNASLFERVLESR